jgi:hypothetical protein
MLLELGLNTKVTDMLALFKQSLKPVTRLPFIHNSYNTVHGYFQRPVWIKFYMKKAN